VLRAARRARFVVHRLTPGALGLELTTLLALAAVGTFAFFGLEALLEDRTVLPLDREAFSVTRALHVEPATTIVARATDLGSLPVTAAAVLATAAWALVRRRGVIEAVALPLALGLTFVAVHVAKAELARPRPSRPLVESTTFSFPSGHSAYAVALVACAIVLVRAGHGLAVRFAAVTVAVGLAAGVALSRVYLRAHYLSDTLAGVAIAVAVFALVGIAAVVIAHLRHNPSPT
jgi:membrane-associated phospholipid phosphatase